MTLAAWPTYDRYKDSGVEWISDLPSSWTVERGKWLFVKKDRPVRAEDEIVTCFRDGQVTLRNNRRTEGFTNALKEHGYQGIRKGDLVIHAMDAFAGAIGVSDSDGKSTPVYSACVPRVPDTVDPYFYAYYMRHIALSGLLISLAKGIRERSTDFRYNDFADLQLAVPPLPEQRAIAVFLDEKCAKVDAAVRIKEEQIALLRERRQILIQQAVTCGLNPAVPKKDSGVDWIGQIPAHWEVRRSKYVFAQRKELARKDDIQLSATQSYGVIPQDEFEDLVGRRVVKIQTNLEKRKHVEIDDFVISMRSFQGGLERAFSTGCIRSSYVILSSLEPVNADFFGYLFKSPRYIKALQATGSFIRDGQDLNFDNFSKVDLFLPPLHEQAEIAAYIRTGCEKIDNGVAIKEKQITALKEYKTSMINAAVTGKIKVA